MSIQQQLIIRILFVIAKIVAIGGEPEMVLDIKNLANHINSLRNSE